MGGSLAVRYHAAMKKRTTAPRDLVVFATFETEYFALGGLGAVMKLLPGALGKNRCVVLAPLFRNLVDLDALKQRGTVASWRSLFTQHVLVRGIAYPVEVIEAVNRHGLRTFFIASPTFFQAVDNPYVNPCRPGTPLDPYRNPINGEKLTEDALFFCIAAPLVLAELAKDGRLGTRRLVLHLQDWETAAIAQALLVTATQPGLTAVKCVLTIHNPYDRPLHAMNSPLTCDFARHLGLELNHSVLEQTIPLLDAPVSTVSSHFAHELRNEVLYTQIFCPHLQRTFKRAGLIGIENGIFGEKKTPFSAKALAAARRGDPTPLVAEKRQRRAALADVVNPYLARLRATRTHACWGGPLKLDNPDLPVFFMLGRDDPRQKGFDVIVEAIQSMPRGAARYLFAVMPGDEGQLGLRFLRRLAEDRPDEVCVFPFRVEKEVFQALLGGCSYMVMGSMYEPFGAANEAYLAGMPCIARATGGLVQQVVPHESCLADEAVLSLYGRMIARKYHRARSRPTGLLFREHVNFAEEVEGWRDIIDCGYWNQNPKGDRLAERRRTELFRHTAASAAAALRLAITLYRDPDEYGAMIYHGWKLLDKFSWEQAAHAYRTHLYTPAFA